MNIIWGFSIGLEVLVLIIDDIGEKVINDKVLFVFDKVKLIYVL